MSELIKIIKLATFLAIPFAGKGYAVKEKGKDEDKKTCVRTKEKNIRRLDKQEEDTSDSQKKITQSNFGEKIADEILNIITILENAKSDTNALKLTDENISYRKYIGPDDFPEAISLARSSIEVFKNNVLYNRKSLLSLYKTLKKVKDPAINICSFFDCAPEDIGNINLKNAIIEVDGFKDKMSKLNNESFLKEIDKKTMSNLNGILTEWNNILKKIKKYKPKKNNTIPNKIRKNLYTIEVYNKKIYEIKKRISKKYDNLNKKLEIQASLNIIKAKLITIAEDIKEAYNEKQKLQSQANELKSQNAKLNNELRYSSQAKDRMVKKLVDTASKCVNLKKSNEVLKKKSNDNENLRIAIMEIAKDQPNTLKTFVDNAKDVTDLLKKKHHDLVKYSTKDIILSILNAFGEKEQTAQE